MIWLLLAACSGAPEPAAQAPSDPTVPVDGDVLVMAVAFDPGNANPLVAPYALSGMLTELVQPGLALRQVRDGGMVYEPALAESWALDEAGTTLTYTLREGLTWGDGAPLTSADVAFSSALVADPAVASNWHGDADKIASVETPDPRTVIFRFTAPRNPVLQQGYTFRGVVPKHALESADRATLRGHESARAPLASGPFRIASWKPDTSVTLERNPMAPADWRPRLDRILLKVIPEYSTRLIELQRGSVDLLTGVEIHDVPTLEADPRLDVVRMPAQSMQYIGYDLTDARFADPRVRQALTLGLDRDKLIGDLLTAGGEAYGQPCVGTVAPTLGGWFASDLAPLPFDPERAAALLTEAGWVDTDRDGVRDRDGEPLRFGLMVQNGHAQLRRAAILTQAAWKPLGVQLDIETVEPTRFAARAREHDFDAILWSFGANPRVDLSIQWRHDGRYNWFGYANPEVDALIDRATGSVDVAEAQRAVREVQRLVHADQPVTFLFWQDEIAAIHKRFRGASMNTFTVLDHAERWYVPHAEQKYR